MSDTDSDPTVETNFQKYKFEKELELKREEIQLNYQTGKTRTWAVSVFAAIVLAIIGATQGWITSTANFISTLKNANSDETSRNAQLEQSYLDKYMTHALNNDLEYRKDFALYVAYTAINKDTRTKWDNYYKKINEIISQQRERKTDLAQKVDTLNKVKNEEEIKALKQDIEAINKIIQGRNSNIDNKNLQIIRNNYDSAIIEELLNQAEDAGTARWMRYAILELGVTEVPGPKANPRIQEYFVGTSQEGSDDSNVPWTGALINWVLKNAGASDLPQNPSLLSNWSSYGQEANEPIFGYLGVFQPSKSGDSALVGFIIEATKSKILILVGNHANQVNIMTVGRDRLKTIRQPVFNQ